MRVLHVHSGNLYGGVETTLLAQAFHRDAEFKMDLSFALCFGGRFSEELAKARAPVHFLGGPQIRKPLSVWRVRQRLRSLLERQSIDVVITHSCWSQAIFGPVIRSQKLPLVFWLHDTARGHHWLERMARRTSPDLVLCNSRFTSSSVSNLYSDVPCEVVYPPYTASETNGNTAPRDAIRRQFNTPSDMVVIIQVARMENWKGHETHLRALHVLKDDPRWICWQIGAPQRPSEARYFSRLQSLTQKLGIANRIHFLGHRTDVRRVMSAADVFCQPNSGPEPFGLVFIEALAARLPVITTGIGGGREIVGENFGFLVPPRDPTALACVLRNLIGSASLRQKFAASGPARARELCDPSLQMRKVKDILANLILDFKEQRRYAA